MLYIVNSFSINMIADDLLDFPLYPEPIYDGENRCLRFKKLSAEELKEKILGNIFCFRVRNAIGHSELDNLVRTHIRELCGVELEPGERLTVKLRYRDQALVAQYRGPRLPEGATSLPEGAEIEYWSISGVDDFKATVFDRHLDEA